MSVHLPKTKETVDIINAEALKNAQPHLLLINTARGGIVNQNDLYEALRDGVIGGAGLDVFEKEPTTESPLFELDNVVVTPHLGASTSEAQDKAGLTIAEQMALALEGSFVPFALNLDAKAANAVVAPYIAVAQMLGRVASALSISTIVEMRVYAQGKISQSDCSILTLSALTGLMKDTSDEPVSLVNAPALAKARGLSISDSRESDGKGHVSRLKVSVTCEDGTNILVYGAITGKNNAIRIVRIDQHEMDVVKSAHLLIVSNTDSPGMVGVIGTILGDAKININGMDVGQGVEGGNALTVISTTEEVPSNVVSELEASDGIVFARTVELD
jgi:D-3-phosphoglycerate dehydrogenase / 2-oxoglutarate reductase